MLAGLIIRIIALASIIAGFALEYLGYENQDVTGGLVTGGIILMVLMVFSRLLPFGRKKK